MSYVRIISRAAIPGPFNLSSDILRHGIQDTSPLYFGYMPRAQRSVSRVLDLCDLERLKGSSDPSHFLVLLSEIVGFDKVRLLNQMMNF